MRFDRSRIIIWLSPDYCHPLEMGNLNAILFLYLSWYVSLEGPDLIKVSRASIGQSLSGKWELRKTPLNQYSTTPELKDDMLFLRTRISPQCTLRSPSPVSGTEAPRELHKRTYTLWKQSLSETNTPTWFERKGRLRNWWDRDSRGLNRRHVHRYNVHMTWR